MDDVLVDFIQLSKCFFMRSRNWILYELILKHLVVHETVVRLRNQSLIAEYDAVTFNGMSKAL